MKSFLLSLLASVVVILTLLVAPATAQREMLSDDPPPSELGGWPPPFVTSWTGTAYTLPFGAERSGQEVRTWALSMPAVQEAMAEAVAHGAIRRPDSDAAYSLSGYSCAVIGFEYPGVSIDSVAAIICIVTKVQPDNGRACTNIWGGAYGQTIINDCPTAFMRDDVPGAFQIAVAWTNPALTGTPAPGTYSLDTQGENIFTVWWETTNANMDYWSHAVWTDRSVGVAFVNQVALGATGGGLATALAGIWVPIPGGAIGIGIIAVAGGTIAALGFINQPVPPAPPKPKMMMPSEPELLQTGATKQAALGVQRPSWGQLKAAYR